MNNKEDFISRLKRGKVINKIFFYFSLLITIVLSIGFYFFIDFFHSVVFKNPDFNDDSKIILLPSSKIDEGVLIKKNKIDEVKVDYKDSENYMESKIIIENHYTPKIRKLIKENIVDSSSNVCRIEYDVSSKKASVSICDDYVFKRNVDLAINKVSDYKGSLNIDNKKIKSVSFDYRN